MEPFILGAKHCILVNLYLQMIVNMSGRSSSFTKAKWPLLAFGMWFCGALFYFMMSVFRGISNPISQQLKEAFHLTSESLGLLGTSFYWTYCLAQIPVGICADTWGTKKTLLLGGIIFTIGLGLFSMAQTLPMVVFARALTGLGGAAAFIGTIRLGGIWFAPGHVALVIGMTTGIGKTGGASVNLLPWTYLETAYGWSWRHIIGAIAGVAAFLMVIIFVFLKDNTSKGYAKALAPEFQPSETDIAVEPVAKPPAGVWSEALLNLFTLIKLPSLWLVGLFTCFLYVILSTFGDIFSKDFLMQVYPDLAPDDARFSTAFLLLGNCVGSPTMAFLSDTFKRRRLFLTLSASLLLVCMGGWLLCAEHVPLWGARGLLFVMGMTSAAQSLSFAIAGELAPASMRGTATGLVNMVAMSGGMYIPILIGRFMDVCQNHHTSLMTYKWGLSLLCLFFLLWLVLSFFVPETFPKKTSAPKKG